MQALMASLRMQPVVLKDSRELMQTEGAQEAHRRFCTSTQNTLWLSKIILQEMNSYSGSLAHGPLDGEKKNGLK